MKLHSYLTVYNICVLYFVLFLYQRLVIVPVKKELGLAFKGNQKNVVEALEVVYNGVCLLAFRSIFLKKIQKNILLDYVLYCCFSH